VRLPTDAKRLTKAALEIIDACTEGQATRASTYRSFGTWVETGKPKGGLALANLMYGHVDRTASHLFSPTELRFGMNYENIYPQEWLDKGAVAARLVSLEWQNKNIDILFGVGVKEALTYGSYLLKQLAGKTADGAYYYRGGQLVPPWAFGVYDEGINDLDKQEALVETVWLNRHEVWRRIRNLPNAERIYKRILAKGDKEDRTGVPRAFMHQVLSTAILDTSLRNATQPNPGGIVNLGNDPNMTPLSPRPNINLYPMHEIYVRDDARGGEDYTTIQLIEPDILVAPLFKHCNLFVPDRHPYSMIQPNYVAGYVWGRSEITDLMLLQDWLSTHLEDSKRLVGLQVDRILAFPGHDGITDELYGKFRQSGYIGLPGGSDVKDITPPLPPELIPIIGEIIALMERATGFPPIMSGQGEPGVRAGVHADTLMKTGSPRLRDRSLLIERQCAAAADDTLAIVQAKDGTVYWTDPDKGETDFLLSQLPEDRQIAVDSHSSSPIYHDDHAQLIAWGVKSGVLGPEDAIEDLPFPNKDQKLRRLKHRQEERQKFMIEHPEFFTHGRGHPGGGHS
jgi:hypothetical protein